MSGVFFLFVMLVTAGGQNALADKTALKADRRAIRGWAERAQDEVHEERKRVLSKEGITLPSKFDQSECVKALSDLGKKIRAERKPERNVCLRLGMDLVANSCSSHKDQPAFQAAFEDIAKDGDFYPPDSDTYLWPLSRQPKVRVGSCGRYIDFEEIVSGGTFEPWCNGGIDYSDREITLAKNYLDSWKPSALERALVHRYLAVTYEARWSYSFPEKPLNPELDVGPLSVDRAKYRNLRKFSADEAIKYYRLLRDEAPELKAHLERHIQRISKGENTEVTFAYCSERR